MDLRTVDADRERSEIRARDLGHDGLGGLDDRRELTRRWVVATEEEEEDQGEEASANRHVDQDAG